MPPITVAVDAHGNISCDPDIYAVPRNSGTVNIFWRMDTTGYRISGISGLPSGQFFDSVQNGGTGWKVKDKNDNVNLTDYPYRVRVASTATGEVTEHDPIIRNGGQDDDLIP
jgi:hypothetical protein